MTLLSTPRIARPRRSLATTLIASALLLGTLGSLQGCFLLLGGAAVGGALSLSDRRTSGTQIEDQSIEFKSGPRVRDAIGDRGHVNVTSYDRVVLITGEVPSEADKNAVAKAVGAIENVGSVFNELEVAGSSSLTSRSSDTVITGKVKSALVDAKDLQANVIKVVTERGNVYLMGRVSDRESKRAAEVARSVGGVMKVVVVFEILTDAQLGAMQNR